MSVRIGKRLMDRYRLTAEIGRGGMGVVYRAVDAVLDREVAVKVISADAPKGPGERRFRREAQLAARLEHPAIVPIYDFGRDGDSLFFVMPLLSGTTLHALVRDGALRLGEALEIVARIAEALDYSAARGVVHRDVKPENVLVSRPDDGEMRVWVMDFGLALGAEDSRITQSGKLPGTLPYLSPEYVLSLELDGRSDLYSLGVVLYECLLGDPPFRGPQGSVLYRIVHEPPPPLVPHGIDEELERLVLSCLAKEPGERPQRGRDLADALRRYRDALGGGVRMPLPISQGAGESSPKRPRAASFVGRRGEISELQRRFWAALGGEGQLVVVRGEAGVGKTRLLEEIEAMARARGTQVLWGRFPGHGAAAFPHLGFCELVQDHFRGRQAGGAELAELAPELVTLFPVLREIPEIRRRATEGSLEPVTTALTGDPTRIYELLARTLLALAAGQPAVFLLENLHSAEASCEALQYVARRLGPTPTLLVGTYRPSEVSRRHPLSRLLRGFRGDPRFLELELGPLDAEEHRDLVASLVGGSRLADDPRVTEELASRLYRVSEGNPFFTRELVRSLTESGEISRGGDTSWTLSSEIVIPTGQLPETIQQAVESRLERLADPLLEVLSTASVLGRSFDPRDLRALSGNSEDVEEAIERLLREGLLEEDRHAGRGRLRFSSGMVCEVLHGKLGRRRRRRLHRLQARRLEKRYGDRLERVYPQLVHHFSHGDVPDETVTYALMLARLSAAAFAVSETLGAARTALEFLDDVETDDRGEIEGELRLLLARASRLAGNADGALREAGKAARAYERAGEATAAAGAALVAAELAWQVRRVEETRRWLAWGIELARGTGAEAELRELLTRAATVSNLRGEHAEARAFLEEADALLADERDDGDGRQSGGTLRTVLSSPPTSLDPALSSSFEDAEVLGNVFEPLLDSDADGNPRPRLVSEWTLAPDATALEVVLRPGVRFADGAELTADGVKRSLEDAARLAPAPLTVLRPIDGHRAFREGEVAEIRGIVVCGERQVRFELGEPLPIFPMLLSDLRTAITRRAGEGSEPIGTGPFRIHHSDATGVVLTRNPHAWWPPRLERLELRVAPDAAAIATGLRSGEIDLGRDLAPADLERALREPELWGRLIEAPRKNVYFAVFHASGPVVRDRRVRQALAGVVHAQDLVWRTLGRFAQPATCLIPPGVLGHDAARERQTLSREQARSLLSEAGLAAPIELRAVVHPLLRDRYVTLLEALIDEWAELGVELAIEEADFETYLERWGRPDGIDLLIGRWLPDYDDPDSLTYALFHSRQGVLRRYYGSPELDRLLERARHERRPMARQALYRRVEDLLADELVLVPLFHDVDYRIVGPRLAGVRLLGMPPYVSYREIAPRRAEPSRHRTRLPETLRVPMPARFDTLEPALALYIEPAEVLPTVFETLMRVDQGTRIVPNLASELRVETGGRRLRFSLREDVRFHDGRPLAARDVRFSFERLLRSPYPGVEAALLPISGARALARGEATELRGFEIFSERDFAIELEKPLAFFPAMLTNPMTAIVPEGAADFGGSWRDGCVGTGPYRAVRLDPGERIDLEANPHYRRAGHPRIRRLVFELGVEPGRVAEGFRQGRYAVASSLEPGAVEALLADPVFAPGFRETPGFATYFLLLNARQGPFSDPEIRHAFVSSLEVEAVLRTAAGRLALPAMGIISPGLLGHEAQVEKPAGESSPERLIGLELRLSVHPAYLGPHAHLWQEFLRVFDELGLDLVPGSETMPEILAEVEQGSVDLVAARRIASYPDTDAMVSIFHSRNGLLGGLLDSPRLDLLIEKGRSETNPALRHAIYRELERVLEREALLVPLFDEQVYCFVRPEIEGLRLRFGWPRIAYEELRFR